MPGSNPHALDRETRRRLRDDPVMFAEKLLGAPLWAHQQALALDPARIRVVIAGRQVGKSRTLAVLALHGAYARSRRRVLIVSAGDAASIDLLAEISWLATSSPLLAGSVVDEGQHLVTLSNGSTIRSVPASQRQVRGKAVDLLIVDEACFVAEEIWTAARYTILARPGSRAILASTPWGPPDRFCAQAYRAGQEHVDGYSSHHWPSELSPLVDRKLLAQFRATMTEAEYQAEVMGEWVDASGLYFTPEELDAAVALGGPDGSPLMDPAAGLLGSGRMAVDVGIDWGFATDANALVALADVPPELPFAGRGRRFVPLVVERFRCPYNEFIDEVVAMGSHPGGVRFRSVRAETNGVGAMPTQVLFKSLQEGRVCSSLQGVTTTAQTKADAFGAVKMMLQQGLLVLPRHPGLLRQLQALEYQQLDGGALRLHVPRRRGHDDLAMALSMAAMPMVEGARGWDERQPLRNGWTQPDGRIVWEDEGPVAELIESFLRQMRGSEMFRGVPEEERRSKAAKYAFDQLGLRRGAGLDGRR